MSLGNPLLLIESCNALTKAATNLAEIPNPINTSDVIMSHNFLEIYNIFNKLYFNLVVCRLTFQC